jgi:uncharacterized BrkB/YihY/UPF0761 family membrane protein
MPNGRYSILAIFPALAALVAIYGLFADPASIAKHLDQVAGFIPGGAVEVARTADAGCFNARPNTRLHLHNRACDFSVER